MGPSARRHLALAAAFARAAPVYWLSIFPEVQRQLAHWQTRAAAIPDPGLRRLALATQADESGNLEGAAAFATFVPSDVRTAVIQAAVAFQAVYDYVDSLVEQPTKDPVANGRALHQALDVALTPGRAHPDYYAHHPQRDDGGYLTSLVDACRTGLRALPAYPTVRTSARRAVGRMVEYQTLIHAAGAPEPHTSLMTWAKAATPDGLDFEWWETAAAAASSLLVFALIAEAARPDLSAAETAALERAYFPWIGALHVLLDSLIDQPEDAVIGHPSLVENYQNSLETAERMSAIARRARVQIGALRRPAPHVLLLTAMCCFYLSSGSTRRPSARLAARRIASALGVLTRPMLLILRLRRAASRVPTRLPRRTSPVVRDVLAERLLDKVP
jgi:tetraprenyl-beta-curcumene synthase